MTRPTNEYLNYLNQRIMTTNESKESAAAKEELLMDLSSVFSGQDKRSLRVEKYAKDIMTRLMRNFVIRKGSSEYEIIEAEFYLFSDIHRDITVYPRTQGAGRFWFHDSGVDITLKSEILRNSDAKISGQSKFGGILIRSLKKKLRKDDGTVETSYIFGPQNCVAELWSDSYAFSINPDDYPVLAYNPNEKATIDFEKRFYSISDDETKRQSKLDSLNNRFENNIQLSWKEFNQFLEKEYRAVRTDILSNTDIQKALKNYRNRKPSPCPKAWAE